MLNKLLISILLITAGLFCQAQDPQFSQYYAAPLFLNPGFTGTSEGHRFVANYRIQWPSLPKAFTTFAASYDYHADYLKSGFGLLLSADRAGVTELQSTNVGFLYSYKLQLMDRWVLSPGLYFGYGIRDFNYNKLIFGDQLAFNGNGQAPTTDPIVGVLENSTYFDFGTGVLVYNKFFWGGFSVYHLNEPNNSILGADNRIPAKYSVHAGVRINIQRGPFRQNKVTSIAPSFIYKNQGQFDQLDLGFHFLYEPVMVGFWYRGLPLKQSVDDNVNQDAAVLSLGMRLNTFELSYSYDFTISRFSTASGGAHEVAVIYHFEASVNPGKVRRKDKLIPCPTFVK